jgi:mono/diheme cytochrome c family protein
MRRCAWAALAGGLVVAALVAVLGAALFRGGLSARTAPSALEERLARTVRRLTIPSGARDATNPFVASPAILGAGLAHFADHCATCHANDGSGQTAIGRNLYPRAPDMRRPATQELTDGELFYVIENGIRLTGMPAWSGPGSADGSWHLVHFIRRLPKLTVEEKAQMEALNPRSPDEWRALEDEDEFLRGEAPRPREPGHGAHAH